MATVLWFGNVITEDGFGRIGNELLVRLQRRGHIVAAAGVFAHHVPYGWPYQVWALLGHDWPGELRQIIAAGVNGAPWDLVIACQDWPYLQQCALLPPPVDWSRTALVGITPTDGMPIAQQWIDACPRFDALYTISRFGVTAFRLQGGYDRWRRPVQLLTPGVDPQAFFPATTEEKVKLREQAGLPAAGRVLGSWMQNQGRKCWPEVLELFGRYRLHRPDAWLVVDADRASPMGWDLPVLAQQIAAYRGLPPFGERILYKDQLLTRGLTRLRDRLVLADVALQLATREGYGLPIAEAQNCGVLTLAQDWCSGMELCGNGRGLLCRSREPGRFGTWGNALDRDPDLDHALALLLEADAKPAWAAAIVERARAAVRQETWDAAADVLAEGIGDVLARRVAAQPQVVQGTTVPAAAAGVTA